MVSDTQTALIPTTHTNKDQLLKVFIKKVNSLQARTADIIEALMEEFPFATFFQNIQD